MAAPQWRGREPYAASFELMFDGVIERRLFLCIALRGDQLDACSKSVSLLWAIFFLVGLDVAQLRALCGCVVAILSDSGVERLVVDMPELFEDFVEFIGGTVSVPAKHGALFPKAVRSPGWD